VKEHGTGPTDPAFEADAASRADAVSETHHVPRSETDSVLVEAIELTRHFPVRQGVLRRQVGAVRAVDGVSFQIHSGETLGLVGESGSGKSTLGRTLLHLLQPTSGSVRFDGVELSTLPAEDLRQQRRHMQMVFQDPLSSLNPRRTIGASIREPLDIHHIGTAGERVERVRELLERVGLNPGWHRRYPHEFSGGQRQRVGIARALATRPRFLVADEPISALDVSIQAQIVNLMADLKSEMGLTYLFIAHDLAMIRHLSDRVAVLYLGRIVEIGPTARVFGAALHPYTRGLQASIPTADPTRRSQSRGAVQGEIPDPAHPPEGCRFHPRCPLASEICRTQDPALESVGSGDHLVACHHA